MLTSVMPLEVARISTRSSLFVVSVYVVEAATVPGNPSSPSFD